MTIVFISGPVLPSVLLVARIGLIVGNHVPENIGQFRYDGNLTSHDSPSRDAPRTYLGAC